MTKLNGRRRALRAVKTAAITALPVSPPPGFPAEMLGEFKALVALLQSRAAWNPALVHSVEHYLGTLSIYRCAMAEVVKNGAFAEDGKATDALKIALQAASVLKAGAAALGLTGMARVTGGKPPAPGEVGHYGSPWEAR